MHNYSFGSILLNGNEITLNDVLSNKFSGKTEFENHTISFIQRWLGKEEDFTFHTSGSTGAPKPILLSRGQIQHNANLTIQALKLQPGETALICLHTKYIAGSMMLARAILNDMRIIANEPSSDPLAGINQPIDFVALVPLQLHTMLSQQRENSINAIRTIIVGGASMDTSLRDLVREKITTSVFLTYGMTETVSHIALQQITPRFEEAFNTMPGIELGIDSRDCLVISADYLNQPVITNDLATLISDKTFRWLGRVDNIINSGGLKVIPERLEEMIQGIFKSLNIDNRFFISSEQDSHFGRKVILFIEGKPLRKRLHSILSNELNKALLPFEIPKKIYYEPLFEETASGKVDRFLTQKNKTNNAKTLQ